MHTPVFLEQVLSHVHKGNNLKYIDCTFGEGGHTRALAHMGIKVLALDADQAQVDAYHAEEMPTQEQPNINVVQGNFAYVKDIALQNGFDQCDGIIFDLGLSMCQIRSERGFSYKQLHQPLDMVIDTIAKQRGTARAADVVALYSVSQLTSLFENCSERIHAYLIAKAIVDYRMTYPIKTVGDLVQAVGEAVSQFEMPAIFQALRMEVNEEIESLKLGLEGALSVVKPKGIIQIITFHSVEDRVVKLWARRQQLKELAKYVGRKISEEKFERSAILRVYER